MFQLSNSYHSGSVAIFLEVCILVGACTVAAAQFLDDGFAQYAISFAVDEDDLLPLLADVAVHDDAKLRELGVQQYGGREPCGVVEERIDMEVNLEDLCRGQGLRGRAGLGGRGGLRGGGGRLVLGLLGLLLGGLGL